VVRSLQAAPWSQRWSVIGIVGAGILVMLLARIILRSDYFRISRETASKQP
jgi:uncharacterized membrane protein YdjX (TVP38/TMEM64 family)